MADTQNGRVAVYLDFDNIVLSWYDRVHGRNSFSRDRQRIAEDPSAPDIAERLRAAAVDVGAIIDYASSFGTLVLTRAYADWSSPVNAVYRSQLVARAVDLVQLFPAAAYAKNGADIRLAVDTVEDMFRLADLTHVVIVAGDSDYVPLAQRCKRLGRYVVGIGVAGSTAKALTAACDEFATYDSLPGVELPERQPQAARGRRGKSQSADDAQATGSGAGAGAAAGLGAATGSGARGPVLDLPTSRKRASGSASSADQAAAGAASGTAPGAAAAGAAGSAASGSAAGEAAQAHSDSAKAAAGDPASHDSSATDAAAEAPAEAPAARSRSRKRKPVSEPPAEVEALDDHEEFDEFDLDDDEDHDDDSGSDPELDATGLLIRALWLSQDKDDSGWLYSSAVKQQMRRMDPSFNERALGFRSFSDFLKSRSEIAELEETGHERLVRLRDQSK